MIDARTFPGLIESRPSKGELQMKTTKKLSGKKAAKKKVKILTVKTAVRAGACVY
jgi:hypothetical protein